MQFVCFHLMPWPHLPADFEQRHESAWLDLPNSLYDPVRGHTLYNEYLDQLVAAERLGFDVIGVNEHHQNAYGLMPSPNIMAPSLIPRTQRIRGARGGQSPATLRSPAAGGRGAGHARRAVQWAAHHRDGGGARGGGLALRGQSPLHPRALPGGQRPDRAGAGGD